MHTFDTETVRQSSEWHFKGEERHKKKKDLHSSNSLKNKDEVGCFLQLLWCYALY